MNLVAILWNRVDELVTGFVRILPMLGIALFVVLVAWIMSKVARRVVSSLLRQADLRPTLVSFFQTLVGVIIWAAGLMIASSILLPGITPGNLLTVLGLGSVAVGFAFKDIFENFLAGILIMLREKVNIGDVIECEAVSGRVEEITLRDTYLRHLSNELVLVPNAYLFKNPLKILTDQPLRRHQLEVGVAYDVDLEAAARVISNAVETSGAAEEGRPVEVFAKEFGDSSINFLVRWWAGSKPSDAHNSRDKIIREIKRALDQAGMEIPFPQRTLWLADTPADPAQRTD